MNQHEIEGTDELETQPICLEREAKIRHIEEDLKRGVQIEVLRSFNLDDLSPPEGILAEVEQLLSNPGYSNSHRDVASITPNLQDEVAVANDDDYHSSDFEICDESDFESLLKPLNRNKKGKMKTEGTKEITDDCVSVAAEHGVAIAGAGQTNVICGRQKEKADFTTKKNRKTTGQYILNSINILNDEEDIPSSLLSSSSRTASGSSSKQNASFSSVTTVSSRKYKNLDALSGESARSIRQVLSYCGQNDFGPNQNVSSVENMTQLEVSSNDHRSHQDYLQKNPGILEFYKKKLATSDLRRLKLAPVTGRSCPTTWGYNKTLGPLCMTLDYYEDVGFDMACAMQGVDESSSDDGDSEEDTKDLLVARLPDGTFVGIKLFEGRPLSFVNSEARVQWENRSARNVIRLKKELESGQTKPESISSQLEFELNLSDEHKMTMEKEREQEEKKWRVQFLQTEMALVKKDCEIKDCIKLDEADTERCLKLLEELHAMSVQPLMFLKHPTVLESVKRLRSYVGNVPAWELDQAAACRFNKQAHLIRKSADGIYNTYKTMFETPEGLSFWEYFSARVMHFKKITAAVDKDEVVVMVHEPPEMKEMTAHTTRAAIDAANQENHRASSDDEKDGLLKEAKSVPVKMSGDKPLKRLSSKKSEEEKNGKEAVEELRGKTRKESAKKTEKEAPKTPTKKRSSN